MGSMDQTIIFGLYFCKNCWLVTFELSWSKRTFPAAKFRKNQTISIDKTSKTKIDNKLTAFCQTVKTIYCATIP